MRNFKDESFIAQYLSPHLIRELKLFALTDDVSQTDYEVSEIHNEQGYRRIREQLSEQYSLAYTEPNIQVYSVDLEGDRSMTLRHTIYKDLHMDQQCERVMQYLHQLWGFDVHLESVNIDGDVVKRYHFPITDDEVKSEQSDEN